jgi:Protein of unknown function (DUF4011)
MANAQLASSSCPKTHQRSSCNSMANWGVLAPFPSLPCHAVWTRRNWSAACSGSRAVFVRMRMIVVLRTLYLAFGVLEWYEASFSDELIRSPLIFVPVALNYKAATGSFTLKFLDDADCEVNPTLREKLNHDFAIAMPMWNELIGGNGNGTSSASPPLTSLLTAIEETLQETTSARDGRWKIVRDEVHLGRFAFQKLVMYQDLQRHAGEVFAHPLLRILGGEATRPSLPAGLPKPEEFDERLPPQTMLEILDADSSQQEAILLAKSDVSFVLKGPPGTGKSQTIANVIAERLGQGKKVLFVSEKMAALEVVHKRLQDAGLGDFCLDLHSSQTNSARKVHFLSVLKTSLDDAMMSTITDNDARWKRQSSDLQDRRTELNEYVQEVHAIRHPLGKSAFDAYGELARLANVPDRDFAIPNIGTVTATQFDAMVRAVDKLGACRDVLDDYDSHLWREARVTSYSLELGSSIRAHYTRLSEALRAQHTALTSLLGLLGESAVANFNWMPYAADRAKAVLATQQPLRSWLSHEALARLRPLATTMVEQSASYSVQLRQFASIYDHALLSEDLEALRQALTKNGHWAMRCLRDQAGSPQDTAILIRSELDAHLTAASQSLSSIPQASDMLAELCGAEQPETLRETGMLLTIARHLLQRPALPPPSTWLDSSAYAVVRATATEVQESYSQCAQMRLALERMYQPTFFTLDLAGLADRFRTQYQSFFRFLQLPFHRDVRLVRSQILPGQVRSAAQIEADIMMAVKLRNTEQALATNRIEHARTLDRYFDGPRTDWEQLTAALRWVTQLHEFMEGADLSGTMRALITGPAKALRPINVPLDRLAGFFAAWEDAETYCLTHLQIAPLLENASSFDAASPKEAQVAIERLLRELRTFWQAMDVVLSHRHVQPTIGQTAHWASLCADVRRARHIHGFETHLVAEADNYSGNFGHFYTGNRDQLAEDHHCARLDRALPDTLCQSCHSSGDGEAGVISQRYGSP